jgi:hypothetical protein
VTPFLVSPTQRFLRHMQEVRSFPQERRRRIAVQVFADIRAYLDVRNAGDLQELRRNAQERRATLIYAGARDFTDVRFAAATIIEQWALARMKSVATWSLATEVLAERICRAVEDFLRENLPDDRDAADIATAEDDA